MTIEEVKKFVKSKTKGCCKDVRFITEYNGSKIYVPVYSVVLHRGLPRYIVVNGDEIKWVDGIDGFRLLEKLCGKEKSILDD